VVKKDNEIKPEAWIRLGIFALAAGGVVYFLSTTAETKKQGAVGGEQSSLESVLPPQVSDAFKVLGEKVNETVPESVKNSVTNLVEEKILRQTKQTVEDNTIVDEIKKTIEQATNEISGFPEKQKKEIKKQVIQQVCSDLLKSVE